MRTTAIIILVIIISVGVFKRMYIQDENELLKREIELLQSKSDSLQLKIGESLQREQVLYHELEKCKGK